MMRALAPRLIITALAAATLYAAMNIAAYTIAGREHRTIATWELR